MDLEDFTIDISYPIGALDFVNKMFVNELFDNYWDLSKDDVKILFNFLHVYSYIVELLIKDMKGINGKYKLKVEEFLTAKKNVCNKKRAVGLKSDRPFYNQLFILNHFQLWLRFRPT